MLLRLTLLSLVFLCLGCQVPTVAKEISRPVQIEAKPNWRGVDLSYVNELEACGATYRDTQGEQRDPYQILSETGANVVRLRLWHTPDWTKFSTLDDVKISIRRARQHGMNVLLDFHYSDDWAHPGKQLVPAAWAGQSDEEMANSLGSYTEEVLRELHQEGLLPDFVQIGNETNTEMLLGEEPEDDPPINWVRNIRFFKAGIAAVDRVEKELDRDIGVMLHIAQPENVEPWFDAAITAGLPDFDYIGISYYQKWSVVPVQEMGAVVALIRAKYGKDVVIVESAYPWTMKGADAANNSIGKDGVAPGYAASKSGQRRYLNDLANAIAEGGGLGLVYWEGAWISSDCETRWGKGSHWENAALFDFRGQLLPGAAFLSPKVERD